MIVLFSVWGASLLVWYYAERPIVARLPVYAVLFSGGAYVYRYSQEKSEVALITFIVIMVLMAIIMAVGNKRRFSR